MKFFSLGIFFLLKVKRNVAETAFPSLFLSLVTAELKFKLPPALPSLLLFNWPLSTCGHLWLISLLCLIYTCSSPFPLQLCQITQEKLLWELKCEAVLCELCQLLWNFILLTFQTFFAMTSVQPCSEGNIPVPILFLPTSSRNLPNATIAVCSFCFLRWVLEILFF